MCNKLVVAGACDPMVVAVREGLTVARNRRLNSRGVDALACRRRVCWNAGKGNEQGREGPR
jgi:hypothetical protein